MDFIGKIFFYRCMNTFVVMKLHRIEKGILYVSCVYKTMFTIQKNIYIGILDSNA